LEAPAVAVMMAVGEQDNLWLPAIEPLQPLRRHSRVDKGTGGLIIVRTDLLANPLVERSPVKEPGNDLLHGLCYLLLFEIARAIR
jgi:hypothetical protein